MNPSVFIELVLQMDFVEVVLVRMFVILHFFEIDSHKTFMFSLVTVGNSDSLSVLK